MLSPKTKEQKRKLLTAIESGNLTKQAKEKLKVLLENGDVWHQATKLLKEWKTTS